MKFVIIASVIMLIGLAIWVFGSNDSDTANDQVPTFSTVEADLNNGAKLIDVRTAEEYASGYIVGASNLSLQDIQAGQLPAAAKTDKIYVYCRSGSRSAQAKTALEGQGYTNVVDLGAIDEVVAMGGVKTGQ